MSSNHKERETPLPNLFLSMQAQKHFFYSRIPDKYFIGIPDRTDMKSARVGEVVLSAQQNDRVFNKLPP